jgi:hypothetical protein
VSRDRKYVTLIVKQSTKPTEVTADWSTRFALRESDQARLFPIRIAHSVGQSLNESETLAGAPRVSAPRPKLITDRRGKGTLEILH